MIEVNCRAALQRLSLEMLELYDGKLSRTVLRRESGRKARDLYDHKKKSQNKLTSSTICSILSTITEKWRNITLGTFAAMESIVIGTI